MGEKQANTERTGAGGREAVVDRQVVRDASGRLGQRITTFTERMGREIGEAASKRRESGRK